jgi:alginate O-acetyltransferase complex protein AlgI
LRDYLYIALGGNKISPTRTQVNLLLTMILGGLWHGASWTFVFWGLLHGTYLVLERSAQRLFPNFYKSRHPAILFLRWLIVFHAICFAWIFFRAASFTDALQVIKNISVLFTAPLTFNSLMGFMLLFAGVHFVGNRFDSKQRLADAPAWVCGMVLGLALCALWVYTPAEHRAFIYFQF